ncbi:hypothetical protein TNCV_5011131 [Trichonephila clavipes]|nr:hypothetical protein TNCV_5011131 [Trichonephila clavipes]
MVTAVYRKERSTKGLSASNREELLYVRTKDWALHRHQLLRVVVEGIVKEVMASIQRKCPTFQKQNANHCVCPSFLLAAYQEWSCHVERSPTIQALREKTSDVLSKNLEKEIAKVLLLFDMLSHKLSIKHVLVRGL